MPNSRTDFKLYLLDISSSTKKILSYTKSKSATSFANDPKTIDAVIRNFEIIGEAANKIPSKIKKDLDLPWKEMVGIRNKVIHEYFDVNVDLIWETVKQDIPNLEKNIKRELKNIGSKQLKLKVKNRI